MDYRSILLFITTGANLSLAMFIFLKDRKRSINILFSLLLLFIAAWSFSIGMFYLASSIKALYFWIPQFYLYAAFIPVFFYYFTHYFPFESKKINVPTHFTIISSLLAILFIIFYFNIAQNAIYDSSHNHFVQVNPISFSLFSIYFCTMIILSFIALYKKIKITTSIQKKIVKIVFASTLISAFFGSLFDLFLTIIQAPTIKKLFMTARD